MYYLTAISFSFYFASHDVSIWLSKLGTEKYKYKWYKCGFCQ